MRTSVQAGAKSNKNPTSEPCAGINGLIEEYQKFNNEGSPSPEVRDVFATGAALKVENYEIASYKSLIKLANQLGLTEGCFLIWANPPGRRGNRR
jgi:ferritin-like metal-binding protein YciE